MSMKESGNSGLMAWIDVQSGVCRLDRRNILLTAS